MTIPPYHNLPSKKDARRILRSNLTPAEAKLWSVLKKSQLMKRKFRRQHSVGSLFWIFIVQRSGW